MPSSLYEWGCSVPWCITPEAHHAMLAIAARETFDADDLKAVMHGPKSLALRDGKRRENATHTEQLGSVARIVIDGPIYRYADYFTKYSGGVTTAALAKEMQAALDDPQVHAIALIIDSPGGEATGINELADTIYQARGQKPIHAYIEGYGASAAYWIASAADVVTVDENALVGSIGTVAGYPDPSKRIKYTIDFVSSQSPKKRVDPTSTDGAAYLQSLVDDMTEVFIAKVMRNRGMTRQQVLAVEGGMVIGQHAVTAGLADRIGSEEQTLRALSNARPMEKPTPPARVPGGSPVRMEDSMNWKEFWGGLFQSAAEAEGTPIAAAIEAASAAPPQPAPVATPDPALADRLAELENQIATQQQQAMQAAAQSFADTAVRNHQALPAEHASLVALYVRAAQDDAALPIADTSRVSSLEALVAARPQHSLTTEQVVTNAAGALPEGGENRPMTEERKTALLAMTPGGQAVLDRNRRARSA